MWGLFKYILGGVEEERGSGFRWRGNFFMLEKLLEIGYRVSDFMDVFCDWESLFFRKFFCLLWLKGDISKFIIDFKKNFDFY